MTKLWTTGPHFDLGFDGAEDLLRAWRDGLTPDPDLTVSAWADKHRVLSSRGATPLVRRCQIFGGLDGDVDNVLTKKDLDRIIFAESLPVGATGKVQKNALRELYAGARTRGCS